MQSSFSPYNTAYLAALILLLCKLLSPLRSFRLKIDILSCFFSVSASLFIMGIMIFRLFFYPQTLGCDRTQPTRHIYEVIRSLALKEILSVLREQRCCLLIGNNAPCQVENVLPDPAGRFVAGGCAILKFF